MRLAIVAVGNRPPAWVGAGCAEYLKRMPRELPLSVIEVKAEVRGTKSREQLLAAERTRLLAALQGFRRLVVLDERGSDLSTLELAQRLAGWMQAGGDTAFVIGSADGVDAALKQQADEIIRLSRLTLPHALARLLLCEQLYRACSVIRNHPYHRED
ncbi:23S rRNA (pseudouridine(1915)-N(3))-methyltransferase RlmH [Accumulibacter sp.]|uniref:23S rRNA (pseudouridine(1915)-N(3))-methyltransferase RlmH n=1 Tax=Accumulibacter sp. TaxID=2053492 RepID=UPI0025D70131|nr:23S rRNA (pseudouridine(1915)-N(3))-methyltransferase RlmH [Accumulibacter sp.]MCM8612414.1 23S rRNA (pseudouridine(1915)-N(3))-methyltransferase RlmH [Accumulibacter sp.]MCM8636811.1 23S rRNA (pseudouridine(1915)-N(3))-methyltransferase RlmH [Accumulibacter sp.]MCM8641136.1 23S rRNA (pseudouridine(1915)-N(3))-methyltransferase RlmH [Accumulibacter sp.]